MHSRGGPRRGMASVPARLALGGMAVGLLLAVAGCASGGGKVSFVRVAAPPPPPVTQKSTVEAMLARLQIGSGSTANYSAERFGVGWLPVAETKCDAFNFVLERDLTNAVIDGHSKCSIVAGSLFDPYTAAWTWYDPKANPPAMAMDHVVSLQNAWVSGANAWDDTRRALFASFPDELLASTVSAVNAKNGADAASWLPPNAEARCEYVSLQIKIKSAYALTVSQPEHDALAGVLQSCPDSFSRPFPTTPPPPPPADSPVAALPSTTAKATNEVAKPSGTPHATFAPSPSSPPLTHSSTPPPGGSSSPPGDSSSPPGDSSSPPGDSSSPPGDSSSPPGDSSSPPPVDSSTPPPPVESSTPPPPVDSSTPPPPVDSSTPPPPVESSSPPPESSPPISLPPLPSLP